MIGNTVRLEFLDELNRKKAEDLDLKGDVAQQKGKETEAKPKKVLPAFGRIIQTNSMFEYPSISSDEIIK